MCACSKHPRRNVNQCVTFLFSEQGWNEKSTCLRLTRYGPRGHESLRHCAQEMVLDVNEPFGSQQFHRRPQSLLVPHMQFKCSWSCAVALLFSAECTGLDSASRKRRFVFCMSYWIMFAPSHFFLYVTIFMRVWTEYQQNSKNALRKLVKTWCKWCVYSMSTKIDWLRKRLFSISLKGEKKSGFWCKNIYVQSNLYICSLINHLLLRKTMESVSDLRELTV